VAAVVEAVVVEAAEAEVAVVEAAEAVEARRPR
jgi:hypothetical protein